MIEVAEIFRQYGPAYRTKHGADMLPSHRQAMWAIEHCRTETLGGHVYHCPDCDETVYRYHSCRNRHCPKCQGEKAYLWLEQQRDLLLPVPYFMLTFTLPDELAQVARSHQALFYDLLFRTSAAATQRLARDPRFVGGQLGLVGVLHTWGRTLVFHPHVHYLVPGGGLAKDGQTWLPAREDFLLPVKALSPIFQAKFRDALGKTDCFTAVPTSGWEQDWVVHCQPVGNGLKTFKYLAPYIFRVAISNSRLVSLENDQVTFRYRDSNTGQPKLCTLDAEEFIRRFLQHVLPKGFVKVRYYGFLAPGARQQLTLIRQHLTPTVERLGPTLASSEPQPPPTIQPSDRPVPEPEVALPDFTLPVTELDPPSPGQASLTKIGDEPDSLDLPAVPTPPSSAPCCPACGQPMRRTGSLPPQGRSPP